GLKLDVNMIRTMGPVALATGLGQVIFTSFFGFLIAKGWGMETIPALYVAFALTYSSTIIIVKLLSDKKEIDSLHGRIAIGFLIVQDIMVILTMIGLSALGAGTGAEESITREIMRVAIAGVLFLLGVFLVMRYILPHVLVQLARSSELLVLFSVAWAVSLAALSDYLGFSKEVGAFLAGVSIGSSPFRESIGGRLSSLRDFLLLYFFIYLGSQLDLGLLGAQLLLASIFSIFVLVGNPIIVMVIMGFMGFRKRTSFLAGLAVAQISEFSLILAALGMSLGHLDSENMGLITLVGLITIGLSTYMIIYSAPLYRFLSPWLGIFERKDPYREREGATGDDVDKPDIILLGLGDYGAHIAKRLLNRGNKVLGVDFDPQTIHRWDHPDIHVVYGDAEDPELLEHLPMSEAHWIVSTVPSRDANLLLFKLIRSRYPETRFVATARSEDEVNEYLREGIDVVLNPYEDAAEQAVDSLTAAKHSLPHQFIWPTSIREVRLEAGTVFAGKTLRSIPLRSETGATILAITRAGKNTFDPGPDFILYPGDRVVLLGEKKNLDQATAYLEHREYGETQISEQDQFTVAAIEVTRKAPWPEKSIADINFRRNYGVTIIGIERDGNRIPNPPPTETIQEGDKLVVAGSKQKVDSLEELLIRKS
ncbi:MAG: cation:proton antiporter, partial [Candidatus Sumerlaeia bacterium]|nr:cation:proton antiporter [Candidatus Sumerlaeia bacterium]